MKALTISEVMVYLRVAQKLESTSMLEPGQIKEGYYGERGLGFLLRVK